jgi:uncharacterized membrane protein YeaQ/YmgE (transglycosylase-associated protein family)
MRESIRKGDKMEAKKHFEKHFSKLKSEALVRSLLAALIIGFVAGFVAAVITWFTDLNGLWISIAALVVATAVAAPIFYAKKYRPTALRSARRIDRLGLEERLVTMVEYEGDESTMAQMQRQDARKKLEELETAQLRLKIAKNTLATLAVTGVLGLAMMVVSGLSAYGLLPNGWAMLDAMTPDEPIKYVSVTYEVEDGGYIEGETDQLIPMGGNTTQVVAVAADGYEFMGWDDGYKKPVRSDGKVTEDIVCIAIFMPLEGDPQESDEAQESQEQEEPKDKPQQDGQKPQETDPNAPPSNNGGGKYEEANQVIDGETYYREVKESYEELLRERLETEGEQMSEEERAIIEAYLGIV